MRSVDPERTPCAVCGIGFTPERLRRVRGRSVCPRCYALDPPERPGGPPRPGASAGRLHPIGRTASPAGEGGRVRRGARVRRRRVRVAASIRDRARGLWWLRAPVLVWLAWILFRYWDAPSHQTIWAGVDLALHEVGHVLWSPFGELMGVAGGTVTQLMAPCIAGYMLYRQRDWFGVAVATSWLGINCFEIVGYAADAVVRQIPLVSPVTAHPVHDWNYMLGELGLLQHTAVIARGWQVAGRLIMGTGVLFGAWILWVMATAAAERRARQKRSHGSRSAGSNG